MHRMRRLKRWPARQHGKEDCAQRIYINFNANSPFASRLFRRHVAGRAENLSGRRHAAVVIFAASQSKVGDLRLAVLIDIDAVLQGLLQLGLKSVHGVGDGPRLAGSVRGSK